MGGAARQRQGKGALAFPGNRRGDHDDFWALERTAAPQPHSDRAYRIGIHRGAASQRDLVRGRRPPEARRQTDAWTPRRALELSRAAKSAVLKLADEGDGQAYEGGHDESQEGEDPLLREGGLERRRRGEDQACIGLLDVALVL